MSNAILETSDLTKKFGGLTAVDEVSYTFNGDEITAIIGPNGAGKTTFFHLLTGVLEPTSGRIVFGGEDITGENAMSVSRRGILRSYQTTTVFEELSVFENVRIAVQEGEHTYTVWKNADEIEELTDKSEAVLQRVNLLNKRDTLAAELSHGNRRKLEIAIALGGDPRLLLLDEPSSGMSPEETEEVISLVEDIADEISVILIEHKMSVVMGVADRILVLHEGNLIADGTPSQIRANQRVQKVYLEGGTMT